jgi:hypothetical protein
MVMTEDEEQEEEKEEVKLFALLTSTMNKLKTDYFNQSFQCVMLNYLEFIDMCMSYRPFISYDLGHRKAHAPHKFVMSHWGH